MKKLLFIPLLLLMSCSVEDLTQTKAEKADTEAHKKLCEGTVKYYEDWIAQTKLNAAANGDSKESLDAALAYIQSAYDADMKANICK